MLTADCVFEGVERGRTLDGYLFRHLGFVEHQSGELGKYFARGLLEVRDLLLRRRLKNIDPHTQNCGSSL